MKYFFMHIVVFGYLLLLTCAFLFSVTRWNALKNPLVMWNYGMLAPFQSMQTKNHDILVEAQTSDGTWVAVDNAKLVALGRGKRTVFLEQTTARNAPPDIRLKRYTQLAARILTHLQRSNADFQAVRLSLVFWPQSAFGVETLRTPTRSNVQLIVRVP